MKNKKVKVSHGDKIISDVYLNHIVGLLKRGIHPNKSIDRYLRIISKYKNF